MRYLFLLIVSISLSFSCAQDQQDDLNGANRRGDAEPGERETVTAPLPKKPEPKEEVEEQPEVVEEPAEPVFAWALETQAVPGLGPDFHIDVGGNIYAVVGEQICVWNGAAWAPLTAIQAGLLPSFHFVSETAIYAVVGEGIHKWDGAAWAPNSL